MAERSVRLHRVLRSKPERVFWLRSGMSDQVASDAEPHRSRTGTGAKLFVVD